jgi:hypothetical protein
MKTFREFVEEINLINENPVLRAALGGAMMGGLPKYAVDTLKLMNRLPVKAPTIRAPLATPKPTPVPTTRLKTPHLAAASLGLSANNTADGTLDAARKRGDYKPTPRGMSNIPPAEAQPGSPSYVAPTQSRSVTTERPSAPRPKPSGPITTAQAGDNVGTPKSAVSTYRDKTDTKGLSVGRYKTLAQHRAAVAAQKNKM